jgi:hypothetical protein
MAAGTEGQKAQAHCTEKLKELKELTKTCSLQAAAQLHKQATQGAGRVLPPLTAAKSKKESFLTVVSSLEDRCCFLQRTGAASCRGHPFTASAIFALRAHLRVISPLAQEIMCTCPKGWDPNLLIHLAYLPLGLSSYHWVLDS